MYALITLVWRKSSVNYNPFPFVLIFPKNVQLICSLWPPCQPAIETISFTLNKNGLPDWLVHQISTSTYCLRLWALAQCKCLLQTESAQCLPPVLIKKERLVEYGIPPSALWLLVLNTPVVFKALGNAVLSDMLNKFIFSLWKISLIFPTTCIGMSNLSD